MEDMRRAWWHVLLLAAAVLVTSVVTVTMRFDRDEGRAAKMPADPPRPVAMVEAQSQSDSPREAKATIGGLQVGFDPSTGEIRPLTKAEAKKLASDMRKMFKPRQVDEPTILGDGTLSAVVAPNTLRFSVGRVGTDGKPAVESADSLEEAIDILTSEVPSHVNRRRPEEK